MTTQPDGGPAAWQINTQYGPDLRDYFAGKALNGLLSNAKQRKWDVNGKTVFLEPETAGLIAFAFADAMLAARERKT